MVICRHEDQWTMTEELSLTKKCVSSLLNQLFKTNFWMLIQGFEVVHADRPWCLPTNGKSIVFVIN